MEDSTSCCSLDQWSKNDFDVFLGRGNHVNYRPGNIRFRQLAATKSLAYARVRTKKDKDAIAAQLVEAVTERGGRFLREIEPLDEEGDGVLEVVTGQVLTTKVKQAMRDALKRRTGKPLVSRRKEFLLAAADTCSEAQGIVRTTNNLSGLTPFIFQGEGKEQDHDIHRASKKASVGPPEHITGGSSELLQPLGFGDEERSKLSPSGIHQLHDCQNNCVPSGLSLENGSPLLQQSNATFNGGGYQLLQQPCAKSDLSSAHSWGFGFNQHHQSQDNSQLLLQQLLLQNKMQQMQNIHLWGELIPTGFGQETPRDQLWLTGQPQQHGAFNPAQLLPPFRGTLPSVPTLLRPHHHRHVDFVPSQQHPPLAPTQGDNHTTGASVAPWIVTPPPCWLSSSHNAMLDDQQQYPNGAFQPPLDQLQPLPFCADSSAPPVDIQLFSSSQDECSNANGDSA